MHTLTTTPTLPVYRQNSQIKYDLMSADEFLHTIPLVGKVVGADPKILAVLLAKCPKLPENEDGQEWDGAGFVLVAHLSAPELPATFANLRFGKGWLVSKTFRPLR